MSHKVILHGMHRSPNFGDVLLTQILRDHLAELPGVQLKLLAPTDDVRRTLEVKEASLSNFLHADCVILGGGGFFQRMDGPKGALKTLVKYALPLFFAQLLGKPTAIIGAGFAPMPQKWLDRLLKIMISRCRTIAVRDQAGYDYLRRLLPAVKRDRIQRVSDLVFAIDESWIKPADRRWAEQIRHSLGSERVIAVHLSEPPSTNENYGMIAASLREVLKRGQGCGVLLLEDHPSAENGQAQAQTELAEILAPLPTLPVPYPGVERLAALLACADAVLTSKLHVGLCAATMGTPPFAVAKHRKNLASFADIEIAENCGLLGDAKPAQIDDIVQRFVNETGGVSVPDGVRMRAKAALQLAEKVIT